MSMKILKWPQNQDHIKVMYTTIELVFGQMIVYLQNKYKFLSYFYKWIAKHSIKTLSIISIMDMAFVKMSMFTCECIV